MAYTHTNVGREWIRVSDQKTAVKRALRLRGEIKSKKPNFVRHESWRYDRLKENWRRPKGIDNKMRMKVKGWPPTVNVGYRGPKAARNLHPSGCEEVLIHNVEEIAKINPATQAIRIAHTVGKKKRLQILSEARKNGIIVLNPGEAWKKEVKVEEKPKEETAEETEKEETEEKVVEEDKKPKKLKKKGSPRRSSTGRVRKKREELSSGES